MMPAITLPEFAISAVIIVLLTFLTLTLRRYAVLVFLAFFTVPVLAHAVLPPHSAAAIPRYVLSTLLYWSDLVLRFFPSRVV